MPGPGQTEEATGGEFSGDRGKASASDPKLDKTADGFLIIQTAFHLLAAHSHPIDGAPARTNRSTRFRKPFDDGKEPGEQTRMETHRNAFCHRLRERKNVLKRFDRKHGAVWFCPSPASIGLGRLPRDHGPPKALPAFCFSNI